MKKFKFLGIAVATLGIAASVGGAIALYQVGVDPVGFGIGAATYTSSTSTVTYKINNAASGTTNPVYDYKDEEDHSQGRYTKLDGVHSKNVSYSFVLGASYADDITAQKFIMGNFSLALENVNANLYGKLTISVWLEGYKNGTYGKTTFGTTNIVPNTVIENGTKFEANRDLCVSVDGAQSVGVWMHLEGVDPMVMNELDDLWDLSVKWSKDHSWTCAYMANNSNGFAEDDEFVMTPNIDKENVDNAAVLEWTGVIKGSTTLTKAKCRKADNWSAGDDATLVSGTTYDAYWSESGAATFTARSA